MSFAGTRPEAIKLAPLAIAAARRPGISHRLIFSGQQPALFDRALGAFSIRADERLFKRSGKAQREVRVIRAAAAQLIRRHAPDLVLVQGDTNTALAAAKAAADCNVPLGHVEAGLRTYVPDRPFPEEPNRIAISRLATLNFAPNEAAAANLEREGVPGSIAVTGNTGIDALLLTMGTLPEPSNGSDILLTCHRRENFGPGIEAIAEAAKSLASYGATITLPLHSNPAVAGPLRTRLAGHPGIRLVAALDYRDMIAAIRDAKLVISDSGGLQEECAALGAPHLLLRNETERPEVVASGNCILVGHDCDTIVATARAILDDPSLRKSMSRATWPYGTGGAADMILDVIEGWRQAVRTPMSAPARQTGTA